MIAIGNGEPCPLCLTEKDISWKMWEALSENDIGYRGVFVMEKDKDFLTHLKDNHPAGFEQFLFGGENIGI